MRNFLQTFDEMGNLIVTRSKDCAGYKWHIEWIDGGNKNSINV